MVAAAAGPAYCVRAGTPAPAAGRTGPFTVPPLAYPTNALKPHIDARTMEIHHDRHQGAYVADLNTSPRATRDSDQRRSADVLGNLNALNDDIKFACAQQSRRPRQPRHVLGDHGTERWQAGR